MSPSPTDSKNEIGSGKTRRASYFLFQWLGGTRLSRIFAMGVRELIVGLLHRTMLMSVTSAVRAQAGARGSPFRRRHSLT